MSATPPVSGVAAPAGLRAGHLVLVGLPGAGKSTVGRAVAEALGCPFLDFDVELEQRVGMRVADWFATRGEAAFRQLEIALTDEVALMPPMVVAPGGGWIMNPGVVERLRPPGRLVHLRLSPSAALERLEGSGVVRPLLQGADPLGVLTGLWERRRGAYARADAVLDVENLEPQQVVQSVLTLARDWHPGVG